MRKQYDEIFSSRYNDYEKDELFDKMAEFLKEHCLSDLLNLVTDVAIHKESEEEE